VLVELGVVEQRSKAVYEVLDGASVTDVARRYGVCRQTVHDWLRLYSNSGIGGPRRQELEARQLPAPDGARGRGTSRLTALRPSLLWA
jgi:transposase-like protein